MFEDENDVTLEQGYGLLGAAVFERGEIQGIPAHVSLVLKWGNEFLFLILWWWYLL